MRPCPSCDCQAISVVYMLLPRFFCQQRQLQLFVFLPPCLPMHACADQRHSCLVLFLSNPSPNHHHSACVCVCVHLCLSLSLSLSLCVCVCVCGSPLSLSFLFLGFPDNVYTCFLTAFLALLLFCGFQRVCLPAVVPTAGRIPVSSCSHCVCVCVCVCICKGLMSMGLYHPCTDEDPCNVVSGGSPIRLRHS